MSTVNETITVLSEQLAKKVTIENGKAVIVADAFESTLPEGMTLDTVKAVQQHESDFESALAHRVGIAAVDAMKADATLADVKGTTKMGSVGLTAKVARSAAYPNPRSSVEGQPARLEYSGEVSLKRNPSNSSFTAVRDAVRGYAADLL